MLFSSPIFLFLFLPITLLLYFTIGRKIPNLILITASVLFYYWGEPEFIYSLLVVVFINYWIGLQIQKRNNPQCSSKFYLLLGVILNLGFLASYKYWFFLLQNVPLLSQVSFFFTGNQPKISADIIPLAISFFTFHAISYNVDVYRKQSKAQKNPFSLLLYFLFFPHLLAGPILRYHTVVDQLKKRIISIDDFRYGVERFVIGLAKKVLIADKLGLVVNEIFSIPTDHMGTPVAWVGIIAFSLQIYFDFSGYSDMAIGLARMFGFHFPENFNYPYASTSITEFWKRWHMTLSEWFKDYVYIPLGGNRVETFKKYSNLWTVFILVGIWHGPSWNFIVWGAIQAVFISIERFNNGIVFKNIRKLFKHFYALSTIIIGWVFFRSETLADAFAYLQVLLGFRNHEIIFQPVKYFLQQDTVLVIIIGIFYSIPGSYLKKISANFENIPNHLLRIIGFIVLLVLISATVATQTYNPFLYFRF